MNYPELSSFDFIMRIDDDLWFKKKDATYDLFEELIIKKIILVLDLYGIISIKITLKQE